MRITAVLILLIFSVSFLRSTKISAQTAPVKQWDKVVGGYWTDRLTTMILAGDGNYLLGGYSSSPVSGDKSEPDRLYPSSNIHSGDFWIVKINPNGGKIWDKTFGGGGAEQLTTIVTTADGGFLLAGSSASTPSGEKTDTSRGSFDFWVVRINASGTKQWDKTFGGSADDFLNTAIATPDGGFLLGGYSESGISGDKTGARAFKDYWIVKIDASGNKLWDKTFGGSGHDVLQSIVATNDGGFMLCGQSSSAVSFDKTSAISISGITDYWVVKIDASGNRQWDKCFGGNGYDDELRLALKLPGGRYLLCGQSSSRISGTKTVDSKGFDDYYIIKIDEDGNQLWDKAYGGDVIDYLVAAAITPDDGFILAGYTRSGASGDKSQPNLAYEDLWIVKTDSLGTKQWDKSLTGNSADYMAGVANTADGGFLVGAYTTSGISGDKTVVNYDEDRGSIIIDADYWLIKLGVANTITTGSITSPGLCTGGQLSVNYAATGSYVSGNIFTVQLSDASGSFAAPVNIGSLSSTALSGNITATIPATTVTGSNYRLRVVSSAPVINGSDNGTNLSVTLSPSFPNIKDTMVCQGGNLLLNAPAIAGAAYSWTGPNSFTATTQNISIAAVSNTHAGAYRLTVSVNGCPTSDTVTVTVGALPQAATGNSQTICAGGNVTLGAAAVAGNSYSWTSNPAGFTSSAANPVVMPASSVTYTLTETTAAGCSKANSVIITVNPLPAIPTITAAGNVLTSSSATGNQWYLNATAITGANGQNHTAQASGNYTVQVTQNGCGATSAVFNHTVTAILNPGSWNNEVKVFPNPAAQTIFIKNERAKKLQLQLVDVSGRKVFEGLLSLTSGSIDMGRLPVGVYQLLITDPKKKETVRISIVRQ